MVNNERLEKIDFVYCEGNMTTILGRNGKNRHFLEYDRSSGKIINETIFKEKYNSIFGSLSNRQFLTEIYDTTVEGMQRGERILREIKILE